MKKLFVDKSIEINTSSKEVWDILTKREYTDAWAEGFSSGGPKFHIEANWTIGGPVLWKGEDGEVMVEGKVTALEKNKLLRFTVADVREKEKALVTEEDGITFSLSEINGRTILHVRHGDFSVIPDGEKYRDMSAETWDRVLPFIKEKAEHAHLSKEIVI